MEQRKPGLNKARLFLRNLIAAASTPALPSIRTMALDADVSKATMSGAVRELIGQKVISSRQGSGLSIIPGASPRLSVDSRESLPTRTPASKWERVMKTMGTDLANGVFGDRLPSIKGLSDRYGASYPTIRKVTDRLIQERILTPDRSGFRTSSVCAKSAPGSSIALIARGEEDGRIMLWTKRSLESLRAVEYECSTRGLDLVTVPWMMSTGRLHQPGGGPAAIGDIVRQRSVIGILLWITGIRDDLQSKIISECAATGIPVSILDEFGSPITPGPNMRVFDMAHGKMAGADVGRYLTGKGHRRVAFLSPFHDEEWSQKRYEGVHNTCATSGAKVVPFTNEAHAALFGDRAYASEMEHLLANRISHLTDDHRGNAPLKRVVTALEGPIREVFHREALLKVLIPLFDTAAADKGITAWVGVNDEVALLAWDYLAARGVRVPAQIALCGFDDHDDSFLRGLTSYNFSNTAAIHAMMSHILLPVRKGGAQRNWDRMEIPGFVVERESTKQTIAVG